MRKTEQGFKMEAMGPLQEEQVAENKGTRNIVYRKT